MTSKRGKTCFETHVKGCYFETSKGVEKLIEETEVNGVFYIFPDPQYWPFMVTFPPEICDKHPGEGRQEQGNAEVTSATPVRIGTQEAHHYLQIRTDDRTITGHPYCRNPFKYGFMELFTRNQMNQLVKL